jgi:hypothetical protein
MFAEFVDVEAAHIDTPMSHHGIERPERKKSLAALPARREQNAAMPKSAAKNSPMARKSIQFMFIHENYTQTQIAMKETNTQNNYNKCEADDTQTANVLI